MTERKVLTIGLLCSGRPETERCLASLMQLIENVDSELIVLDTGADKRLREKIDEMADVVIDYKWQDNFADARNKVIDEAKGQWILFIDDDEFFLDCEDLIRFFDSKEKDQYDAGGYIVRNYQDAKEEVYSESSPERMFRNDGKVKYVGRVHEHLVGHGSRIYFSTSYVGHTGYLYASKEAQEQKSKRNIALIEKELEDNPDDFMMAAYLIQEYKGLPIVNEVYEICCKWAAAEVLKEERYSRELATFTLGKTKSEIAMGWQADACSNGMEIIDEEGLNPLGVAAMIVLLLQQLWEQCKFTEIIKYAKMYFEIEEYYAKNQVEYLLHKGILTEDVFGKNSKYNVVCYASAAGLKLKDQQPLQEYFDIIDWNDKSFQLQKCFVDEIALHLARGEQGYFDYVYEEMSANPFAKKILEDVVKATKEKIKKHPKLLTISMLCCGRPDTKRCLDSLKPILEKVDSELIIVDTGCDEEQRVMIEEYATRIIPFEWCKDFAKARNVGVDAANGEWFMYIDDDEWFLDTADIIKFFNGPQHEIYDMATYNQRNYRDRASTAYNDVPVSRIIKLKEGVRFRGRIHEYIGPAGDNTIFLDCPAGHFGYIYDTPEELEAHSRRNVEPLLEMMKEEPGQLRWPMHLAQEYRALKDYDKLHDLCQDYLDKLGDGTDRDSVYHRGTFAVGRLIASNGRDDRDEELIIREADEFLAKEELLYVPARAGVSLYAAESSYRLQRYEDCTRYCDIFMKGLYQSENNPAKSTVENSIFLDEMFDQYHLNYIFSYYIGSELKLGRTAALGRYLDKIDWENEKTDCLRSMFESMWQILAGEIQLEEGQNTQIVVDSIEKLLGFVSSVATMVDTMKLGPESPYRNMKMVERAIYEGRSECDFDTMTELVTAFVDSVLVMYAEEIDELPEDGDIGTLPVLAQLAICLVDYLNSFETDPMTALECLKEAIVIYPAMKEFLATYSRVYGDYQATRARRTQRDSQYKEMLGLEQSIRRQESVDATVLGQMESILMQTYGVHSLLHQEDRKQVVFLPYKAAMWDSLEDSYLKWKSNPEVDVYVVPIPYLELDENAKPIRLHCEDDKFPADVQVFSWELFDLEAMHPDMMYIHNPYDGNGLVTQIHPQFYSTAIHKYTDTLVYIPYFVTGEINEQNQDSVDRIEAFSRQPGAMNADIVILESEQLVRLYKQGQRKEYAKMGFEYDEEYHAKRFVIEPPSKEARLRRAMKNGVEIPEEWKSLIYREDGSRKKVMFYNTSVNTVIQEPERYIAKLVSVLQIFKENQDRITLLWRPHPLMRSTIQSLCPEQLERYDDIVSIYKQEGWGIYDDTPDMDAAIVVSDAYYGDVSSVKVLYEITGKPIMLQNIDVRG